MTKHISTSARILEIEGAFSDGVVYLAHVTAPSGDYEPTVLALRVYKGSNDLEGRKATDDELAVYRDEVLAYVDSIGNR